MEMGALGPYESALRVPAPLGLVSEAGRHITLDIDRYLSTVDAVDEAVLDRCVGPVLDVGCGPGRMVAALTQRGIDALGVDIAPTAVALSRARGAPVLHRSVFDRLPGEGQWNTALVVDGNVGIGGDLPRLLDRLAELVAPQGLVIVETHPQPERDEVLQVRFRHDGRIIGGSFPWVVAGRDGLVRQAGPMGLSEVEAWDDGGRSFVALARA